MSYLKTRVKATFMSQKFSDVELKIKDQGEIHTISAHKYILASGSPVFAKRFYETLPPSVVVITNVTYFSFLELLRFLYTDEVDLSSFEKAQEIHDAAVKYGVQELIRLTDIHLKKSSVTIENIFKLYEFAFEKNEVEILFSCQDFVLRDTLAVLRSPLLAHTTFVVVEDIIRPEKLSIDREMDIVEAVLKWGKKKCPQSLRDGIFPFFKYIRFLTLSIEEFHTIVDNNDILTAFERSSLRRKILEPKADVIMPKGFSTSTVHRGAKSGNLSAAVRKPMPINASVPKSAKPLHNAIREFVIDLPVFHQPNENISCMFPCDIISTIKMNSIQGTVTLVGMQLSIKTGNPNETLEIMVRTLSNTFTSNETTYKPKMKNNKCKIIFPEPLQVSNSGNTEVEVTVEDILLTRCGLCNASELKFYTQSKSVLKTFLSSNRKSDENFYFLISSLIYIS